MRPWFGLHISHLPATVSFDSRKSISKEKYRLGRTGIIFINFLCFWTEGVCVAILLFLLELCKCSATFGEKRPWQYIAVTCTTDVWDHIIFFSQYDVAAPPEPNFYLSYTHTHTLFIFIFYFCFKEVVRLRLEMLFYLELSWDDNSCRGAHAMKGNWPGKSPTLQLLPISKKGNPLRGVI